MPYRITIDIEDVAIGDVTYLAETIWDDNAEALGADRGEFKLSISKDGFPVDWEPES